MAPARDLYRDTWVRYLGYTNEVGESLRALVDVRIVRLSYAVAFGYVFADTIDKAWNMNKSGGSTNRVITSAGDALIWQTLASVIIPGYMINRICAGSLYGMQKYTKLPSRSRKWASVFVGLASIPIIIHPIDNTVTYCMDHTYRKVF